MTHYNEIPKIIRTLENLTFAFSPFIRRASKITAPVVSKRRRRGSSSLAKQLDVATASIEGRYRIAHMSRKYSPIQRKYYHNQATYHKYLQRVSCGMRSREDVSSKSELEYSIPWFNIYDYTPISLLQASNLQFIRPYVEHRSVTLIMDLSAISVWSEKFEHVERGYDIPKNMRGYQLASLLINIGSELKLWSYLRLTPGNETSQRLFDTLLKEIQRQSREAKFKVKLVLMDAGFASREHFIRLDNLKYKFISASPRYDYLEKLEFREAYEEETDKWIRRYAEAFLNLDGHKLKVIRSTVIDKKKGKRKETHFFVTNLVEEPVEKIMKLYSERWGIENNLFRELKSGYKIRMPSRRFAANVVYLLLVQLAFNIFQLAMWFARNYVTLMIKGVKGFQDLVTEAALQALGLLQEMLRLGPYEFLQIGDDILVVRLPRPIEELGRKERLIGARKLWQNFCIFIVKFKIRLLILLY